MNIIKIILTLLGVVFGTLLVLWVLNLVGALIWYIVFFGIFAALGYGGYRLFKKAEAKALGYDSRAGIDAGDINMSWDEYDKKYLHK